MGLKMINSSNTISAIVSLFFVVLLTQSKLFNFLLDTALGRFVLIAFIIIISYLNKILGVVSVLFVIIMFNQSEIAVFEGFTTDNNDNNKNKIAAAKMQNSNGKNNNDNNNKIPAAKMQNSNDTNNNMNNNNMNNNNMNNNNMKNKMNHDNKDNKPNDNVHISPDGPNLVKKTKFTNAQEGFDMIGTENNIKRGKQSNSINVSKSNNTYNNVSAHEGFNNNFNFSAF